MIGQELGHYRIVDRLGAGGMGEVYRAEDTTLHREIALKVLPAELAGSQDRLERFQREAHTLATLDHPNIVHIYSVESSDDIHFLTMQLVRGRSLALLIADGGLELDRFFDLAIPLADALRAAHEKGIIHRDLKPENVMVDEEGRVKVLDFGLAKLRLGNPAPGDSELPTQAMTQEGLVLGTVPYMSPEQVQGRPVDHRTDIFSLGILLYEILCGRRPFQGENTASLVSAIMRDDPETIGDIKAGLPVRIVEIVDRCLAKDADSRYPTAEALRNDLKEVQQEILSGQAVISRVTRVTPLPSRYLRLAVTALVMAVVLLGIYALMSREIPPPPGATPQIASLAVLPLQNYSGDPEQDYFVDGMTEALITDLSKIGALKVISRTSAMRYRGTDKSLADIASELGVDAVIEGSVIREGNQVSITAQLIDVGTDQSLWAERYNRNLTSILKLQAEIAQTIAREIQVTLSQEEKALLSGAREVDPEAYDAVLKGGYHLQRFTAADIRLAKQYFEKAIEIDPDYAPAHGGISGYWMFAMQAGIVSPAVGRPPGEAALRKALELDPTNSGFQLGLASIKAWHDWDWEEAEAGFRRAIEGDPNFARARIFFSHLLSILGRHDEAAVQAEKALELDPLNPFSQALYGIQLSISGQSEKALEQFKMTFEANPGLGLGREPYSTLLWKQGELDRALEQTRADFAGRGDDEVLAALDRGYARAGYEGAMRAAAEKLEARSASRYVKAMLLVRFYDHAGDIESALRWVEKGIEVHEPNMPYISVMPCSEGLRGDPRLGDLLRRMNLPS